MSLFQIRSLTTDDSDAGFDPGQRSGGLAAPAEPTTTARVDDAAAPTKAEVSVAAAHLTQLLDQRERLLATANRRVADLQRQARLLAEVICPAALDQERRTKGQALDDWMAEQWIDFISDKARERLLKAEQAIRRYETLQLAYNHLLEEQRQAAGIKPPLEAAPATAVEPGSQLRLGLETNLPATVSPPPESEPTPKVDPARLDDLVRVLATTGLARANRVREKLSALWGLDRRSDVFRQVVDAAVAVGYLRVQTVRREWSDAPAQLMELTEPGRAQAQLLGCRLAAPEYAEGSRRQLSPETISLVLHAAELLQANGYSDVCPFPTPVALPNGVTYSPALSARDSGAGIVYIECEREGTLLPRDERWRQAAQVGGGALRLITTTQAIQSRLTTEINLVRMHASFRLLVFNVNDCLKGKRGPDGSIWLYQR